MEIILLEMFTTGASKKASASNEIFLVMRALKPTWCRLERF